MLRQVLEVGVRTGLPIGQRIILGQAEDDVRDAPAELRAHPGLRIDVRHILKGVMEERRYEDVLILSHLGDQVHHRIQVRDIRDTRTFAHVVPVADGRGVHGLHQAGTEC